MDTKNLTIGVLSTTALILLVGLLVIHTRSAPAFASGMTTTSGDFVMTVGSDASGDQELVYVLDVPVGRLIAYRFNSGRQAIEILQGIDLNEIRQAAAGTTKPTRGRRRP